jgi:hypothetical protein
MSCREVRQGRCEDEDEDGNEVKVLRGQQKPKVRNGLRYLSFAV